MLYLINLYPLRLIMHPIFLLHRRCAFAGEEWWRWPWRSEPHFSASTPNRRPPRQFLPPLAVAPLVQPCSKTQDAAPHNTALPEQEQKKTRTAAKETKDIIIHHS